MAPAVATCMPAFELIEDRGADYGDLDAASILTDKCWCGGVVLGPEVADWQGLDLAATPVELAWNGAVVDRGTTGAAMGHAFEALAWLANLLAARGRACARRRSLSPAALKTRFLSHCLWPSYDDILDACCAAWHALLNETGRIRSLCTLDWATPVSS